MNNWKGKRIGPFRLGKLLGEGASSVVYEAEFEEKSNPRVKTSVALKIIRTTGRSQEYLSWLNTEIDVLRKLRHPGIVRLVPIAQYNSHQYLGREMSVEGEPFYFSMELLSTRSLREIIASQRYSVDWKLDVFYQIMSTLDYMHYGKVAHRDLKPENIAFRQDPDKPFPQPILLDFGLAGAKDDQAVSLGYASLDRLSDLELRQKLRRPTGVKILWGQYDLYAMGVIAYELFNGCHPFRRIKPDSRFTEVLDILRNDKVGPMKEEIQRIRPLHDLILKMMDPVPENRPRSFQILEMLETEIPWSRRKV